MPASLVVIPNVSLIYLIEKAPSLISLSIHISVSSRSFVKFIWSQIIRANRQFAAYFKGYLPITFKGHITTMPVDILINEKGIVEKVKYAKDLSDHIPLNEVISYSK